MRNGVLLLVAALGPPSAEAEIAVMENGKILYVDRFQRIDDQSTLDITGGGVVTVPPKGEGPQKIPLFLSSRSSSPRRPRNTESPPSSWPRSSGRSRAATRTLSPTLRRGG